MNTSPKVEKLPISKNLSVQNVDPTEVWKDIPGYEGFYQVSSLGRVKSLARNIPHKRHGTIRLKTKILKQYLLRGYLRVCLHVNKKLKYISVHQLVAIVFLNHKPCGHRIHVDHINNIPIDNRVENLQILTHRENTTKNVKKGSSQFLGVFWCNSKNKWISRIRINGYQKHLGTFDNEIDASNAYQKALSKIKQKNSPKKLDINGFLDKERTDTS
tara:strand:+ start:552 stop:1196 length:645 start_codon:yes stop_codon:yes gene_type:complete